MMITVKLETRIVLLGDTFYREPNWQFRDDGRGIVIGDPTPLEIINSIYRECSRRKVLPSLVSRGFVQC